MGDEAGMSDYDPGRHAHSEMSMHEMPLRGAAMDIGSDDRLLRSVIDSLTARTWTPETAKPISAQTIREAMDRYEAAQPEIIVSPEAYKVFHAEREEARKENRAISDIEVALAMARSATDKRTVVVSPDIQHEVEERLDIPGLGDRIRVVSVPWMSPGHAFVINDSEIERIMDRVLNRPITFSLAYRDGQPVYRATVAGEEVERSTSAAEVRHPEGPGCSDGRDSTDGG